MTPGTRTLRAYASLFEPVSYTIRGASHAFEESIATRAFSASLATNPEVVFRLNHGMGGAMQLAATWNGTLRLGEDHVGLWYEADLQERDPDVQAFLPKVERGDVRESSFAFKADEDEWNDSFSRRRVVRANLSRGDVSAVTWGSSRQTGEHGMTVRDFASTFEMRKAGAEATAGKVTAPGLIVALDGRELRSAEEVRRHAASWAEETRRERTDAEVQALGKKGLALAVGGGRYGWPIEDVTDLKAAVQSFGRAGASVGVAKVRAWIIQRARALGATDLLPDGWAVSRRAALAPNEDLGEALALVEAGIDSRADWTLATDRARKPVHLAHEALTEIRHGLRHVDRLGSEDVLHNIAARRDHQESARGHIAEGLDALERMSAHFAQHDPTWQPEMDAIDGVRRGPNGTRMETNDTAWLRGNLTREVTRQDARSPRAALVPNDSAALRDEYALWTRV